MIKIFETPLPDGSTRYPCTVRDIQDQLTVIPETDLENLWAIGLVPSTRKDCWANARYFYGGRPTIQIYSYPASLSYRLPPHTKRSNVESGLSMELEYGLKVELQGRRWVCSWSPDDLRRFITEHVLLHEIGHHVRARQRWRSGFDLGLGTRESEQFAEAYARRHRRDRGKAALRIDAQGTVAPGPPVNKR